MSAHSKTPLRQIKRYGTKGDYVLSYQTGATYNENTMQMDAGTVVDVSLLAFAEAKIKAEQQNETGVTGQYALLVAVDGDFNGDVPVDSVISQGGKSYNIVSVNAHRVKNTITHVEMMING